VELVGTHSNERKVVSTQIYVSTFSLRGLLIFGMPWTSMFKFIECLQKWSSSTMEEWQIADGSLIVY